MHAIHPSHRLAVALAGALALAGAGCVEPPDDASGAATEAVARGGNPNPGIAPVGSRPHGQTYGEWAASWWLWALRSPAPVNPVGDPTGAHCGEGQSGSVWFLAGTFGGPATRACTVPAGTALFFPIANTSWVQFSPDPPFTIAELREIATWLNADATLAADIDGVPVVAPESYRVQSPVFTALLPDDNVRGVDESLCARGPSGLFECYPSLDEGFYLMVEPLPAGDHTIHFAATLPNQAFSLDVTYALHVGG